MKKLVTIIGFRIFFLKSAESNECTVFFSVLKMLVSDPNLVKRSKMCSALHQFKPFCIDGLENTKNFFVTKWNIYKLPNMGIINFKKLLFGDIHGPWPWSSPRTPLESNDSRLQACLLFEKARQENHILWNTFNAGNNPMKES